MPEPVLVQPLCRIMGELARRDYEFPAAAAIKNRHSRRRGVTPVARRPRAHAGERAEDSGQAVTTGRAAVRRQPAD